MADIHHQSHLKPLVHILSMSGLFHIGSTSAPLGQYSPSIPSETPCSHIIHVSTISHRFHISTTIFSASTNYFGGWQVGMVQTDLKPLVHIVSMSPHCCFISLGSVHVTPLLLQKFGGRGEVGRAGINYQTHLFLPVHIGSTPSSVMCFALLETG